MHLLHALLSIIIITFPPLIRLIRIQYAITEKQETSTEDVILITKSAYNGTAGRACFPDNKLIQALPCSMLLIFNLFGFIYPKKTPIHMF